MLMLVWNWEFYLYDLRIIRYISEAEAIIFGLLYIFFVGVEIDLVYIKGRLDKDDNIYDLLMALIFGYNLAMWAPTFITNFLILEKELTLNQLAWSKSEDYQEGKILNEYSIDIFEWVGIDEDLNVYINWLKKWAKQYF